MTTTTADLAELRRRAEHAQGAVLAEEKRRARDEAAAEEERRLRSVDWAFRRISTQPARQAEANARAVDAAAAFDAAVVADFGTSAQAYLAIVRAQAAANAVSAEYVAALNILRGVGLLPNEDRGHRPDPVGHLYAPFPLQSLPSFTDMLAGALEAARTAAFRVPAMTEDPGAFSGPAPTDGEREAVYAAEWVLANDLEYLLGYREQHPEHYARTVSETQQLEVSAYAAGRQARGYEAELPRVVLESFGSPRSETARQEAQL